MSQVLDILSRMRLFAGLSDEELSVLEKLVFVNRVPVGDVVCREGDRSDFVCFVVRGCLDIVKDNEGGGEVVIAHLRPGIPWAKWRWWITNPARPQCARRKMPP